MRRISLLLCTSLLACSEANDDTAPVADADADADVPVADAATEVVAGGVKPAEAEFDEPLTGFDSYVVDEGGLVLVNTASGATFSFPFGSIQSDVGPAFADVRGMEGTIESNDECPAGPMEFSSYGDLILNYQDGYFVGWSTFANEAGDAGPTTMDGISIGRTRAEIEQLRELEEIEDSSLGDEYYAGDLQFILSGKAADARVENMWAGTNCIFR